MKRRDERKRRKETDESDGKEDKLENSIQMENKNP